MADFAHVLRRAEGRLRAPEPERSRILLEIAQDLDDLYHSELARGHSHAEAHRRAEEYFGASEETLGALERVHRPLYARILSRLSDGDQHRADRALLTVFALVAVSIGASSLWRSASGQVPSVFTWPLLGLLPVVAWISGRASIRLFLAPYDPPSAAELTVLLGMAAIVVSGGLLGVVHETDRLAVHVGQTGSLTVGSAVGYLRRAATLLTFALTFSLATLLAWFHLRRRALEIERARLALTRITGVER